MTRTLRRLIGTRVVDEEGADVGRVIDVVCTQRQQRGTVRVDQLVFGTHGWLERIGVRDHDAYVTQWKDVLRSTGDALVIRRGRCRRHR
jgi:sporulation protein YlmC with PRC-barrel domain